MAEYNKDLFLTNLASIETLPDELTELNSKIFYIMNTISNGYGFSNEDLDQLSMEDICEAAGVVYELSEEAEKSNLLRDIVQVGLLKTNIEKIKVSRNKDILFF